MWQCCMRKLIFESNIRVHNNSFLTDYFLTWSEGSVLFYLRKNTCAQQLPKLYSLIRQYLSIYKHLCFVIIRKTFLVFLTICLLHHKLFHNIFISDQLTNCLQNFLILMTPEKNYGTDTAEVLKIIFVLSVKSHFTFLCKTWRL